VFETPAPRLYGNPPDTVDDKRRKWLRNVAFSRLCTDAVGADESAMFATTRAPAGSLGFPPSNQKLLAKSSVNQKP